MSSLNQIPPQFKHMASILRSMTAITLRSKHAVYNGLSGFFFLRFFTPALVAPEDIDPKFKYTIPNQSEPDDQTIKKTRAVTTIPFSQIIQLPFNLQPILFEKFPRLIDLNKELVHKYSQLYNFLMAMSEYDKPTAEYEKPSDEEADEAVTWILHEIGKSEQARKQFIKGVNDLYEKEDEKTSVSFMLAYILHQCFTN